MFFYQTPAAAALADAMPKSESMVGAAGSMGLASRADHQHPRLSSAQWQVTDANGVATFMFTRIFIAKPVPLFGYDQSAAAAPLKIWVSDWLKSDGTAMTQAEADANTFPFGGCKVKVVREVASVSILGAAINANAGSTRVALIALQPSG